MSEDAHISWCQRHKSPVIVVVHCYAGGHPYSPDCSLQGWCFWSNYSSDLENSLPQSWSHGWNFENEALTQSHGPTALLYCTVINTFLDSIYLRCTVSTIYRMTGKGTVVSWEVTDWGLVTGHQSQVTIDNRLFPGVLGLLESLVQESGWLFRRITELDMSGPLPRRPSGLVQVRVRCLLPMT